MHAEALEWVSRFATADPVTVLDLGGRYINGTPRHLFPAADYTVLDLAAGPNVDVVADASTWEPTSRFDIVVCCEVCEHTPVWRQILATAYRALRPGCRLIVTTAAPGRLEHSGFDGMALREGEYYGNVDPVELQFALLQAGFSGITVDVLAADVRAVAVRSEGG